MNENDREGRTSISRASTLEETGEFWDSHSLDDYVKETPEVTFDLRGSAPASDHPLTLTCTPNSKPRPASADFPPRPLSIVGSPRNCNLFHNSVLCQFRL